MDVEKEMKTIEKETLKLYRIHVNNESAINTLFDRINKLKKHVNAEGWI